ncbi:MAG: ASKHA domain-containing protein [Lachnospiraceae bacterium]|nr:ASKHA domain-containing protein [Lachnospiraceae bacterium]
MNITVFEGTTRKELSFEEGDTILAVLQKAGIQSVTAPCGGNGTCGKCRVSVRTKDFSGECLACKRLAGDGMVVELIPEVRVSFADVAEGETFKPDPDRKGYGVACDIGITTVVCRLLNLETGEVLSGVRGSNSQRIFGGEVLSRLKAAEKGHAEELHGLILQQINYYIKTLCRQEKIGTEDVKMAAISANTIMMHFFAGLNPAEISTAPFVPLSLFGETKNSEELGLCFQGEVYLCPCVSGFIGSDVVCGLYTGKISEAEEMVLMVDLGTNTEIVLGNKDRILACAADGGAAFKASLLEHGMTASAGAIAGVRYEEGELQLEVLGAGKARGICGSGFLDVLRIMFEEEILDELGHIADPEDVDSELVEYIGEEEGRTVFYLTKEKNIYISQVDISKFQLAKAAIASGVQILAMEQNISLSQVERLLMGGGFGAFADKNSAAVLGLIPQECLGKSRKLGNVSLTGAISAVFSEEARREMGRIASRVQVMDLPAHPCFNDMYTDNMFFE